MLVTPQKEKVTWFSQQLQFYNKRFKKFGKKLVVDARYLEVPLIL